MATKLEQALETLKMELTDTQKMAQSGQRWMMFGGYRSGRSTLIACLGLEELLIGNRTVEFRDHYPHEKGDRNLVEKVMWMIKDLREAGWNIEYQVRGNSIHTGIVQSPSEFMFNADNQPVIKKRK